MEETLLHSVNHEFLVQMKFKDNAAFFMLNVVEFMAWIYGNI